MSDNLYLDQMNFVFESSITAILLTDSRGTILAANPAAEELFGYSESELRKIGRSGVFDTEDPNLVVFLKKRKAKGQAKGELSFLRKNDEKFIGFAASSTFHDSEGQERNSVFIRDITDQKKAEEELKRSEKEKDILLKEVYHRVKNNLMIISSLLNLQSRYIKDEEALEFFRESQSRANAMALIHSRLYQSTDLKRINFGEYIKSLTNDIFHTYAANKSIKLNMDVDDLMLDVSTTVPLGLILNELISNCMKHAFSDVQEGEIKISFHKKEDLYILKVADNGGGFPETLDLEKAETLGLKLISSLINQIDGHLNLKRENGTEFEISFKEDLLD